MDNEQFGKILRDERNKRGWTLRDMAQRVNSNFAYLSQIEAGLAKPSEELVERIAEAFGFQEKEREKFMFVARNISAQIKEIQERYPNVSPDYFRRALKKEKQ